MTKGKSIYTPITLFVSPLNEHTKKIRNLKTYNAFWQHVLSRLTTPFQDCWIKNFVWDISQASTYIIPCKSQLIFSRSSLYQHKCWYCH